MVTPSVRTADGTVIGSDGKILFFSAERFARDICEGGCCFICGGARGANISKDEHSRIAQDFGSFDLESVQ
jgi:hypothetical protein